MMPRWYLAVSIAAIATAVVAAGCSGNASDDAVMRATLSGDGCRYEGSTMPAPGTFAVEVRNDTSKPADFVLMMLPKDATLKDVEAWFDQTLQTRRQTGEWVVPPSSTFPRGASPGMRLVSFPSICFGGPGWPSFARPGTSEQLTSLPPLNWT